MAVTIPIPKINWPLFAALASFLAGSVGTVVTAIWGNEAGHDVQLILQTLTGVLTILGGGAATTVAVSSAKMTARARVATKFHVSEQSLEAPPA